MSKRHIIVLGGGISGMAAAWELRQKGLQVTLVEARSYLGGRLTSHTSGEAPTLFDNGPHLFLSTYTQARRLFKELRIHDCFQFPYLDGVAFSLPESRRGRLTPWLLPAPVNLVGGLLTFQMLPWKARWRAVKVARLLLKEKINPRQSAANWLASQSQNEELELFWQPLIRAALNAPPERVSIRDLQVILREGFAKGWLGGRLGYANQPLAEIFDVKARAALTEQGVRVILKSQAAGVKLEQGRIVGIYLKRGEFIPCEGVIAALPPWALREWLAAIPMEIPELRLSDWQSNPIATIYLWADNRPWLEPYSCLPKQAVSWVFDFIRLWEDKRAPLGLMLENRNDRGEYDLGAVFQDLFRTFPQIRREHIPWLLVQEKRATPLRPKELWGKPLPIETPLPNLILAGDWLDPLLPPTVEAAVRTGREAGGKFIYTARTD